jgi:O-antigen/teichoic acid export membrane protein
MIIKGIAGLVSLAAVYYLTHSLLSAIIAMAVVWSIRLITFDLRNGFLILVNLRDRGFVNETLRPNCAFSDMVKLSCLALPLGVVMLLLSLNVNIPRYFIERCLGERSLGVFAAMTYIMVAGTTVISALGQSASPRLSQYYSAGNRAAFISLMKKLILVGVGLGITGILIVIPFGRLILTTLYTADYASDHPTFIVVSVAAGITYIASLLGYAMTAARCFRIQTPIAAVTLVSTLVFSFVLVPHYGLLGAALTVSISSAVQFAGSLVVVLRTLSRLNQQTEVII